MPVVLSSVTAPDGSLTSRGPGGSLCRTLGLLGVLTLSIGAMVGSEIFVLPSLAFTITGPSAVIAYLIVAGRRLIERFIAQTRTTVIRPGSEPAQPGQPTRH